MEPRFDKTSSVQSQGELFKEQCIEISVPKGGTNTDGTKENLISIEIRKFAKGGYIDGEEASAKEILRTIGPGQQLLKNSQPVLYKKLKEEVEEEAKKEPN